MKCYIIYFIIAIYVIIVNPATFVFDKDGDVRVTVNNTYYFFLNPSSGSYWLPGTQSWVRLNNSSHPYIDYLNEFLKLPNNGTSYKSPQAVGLNARRVEILPNTQSTTTKKPNSNQTTKKKTVVTTTKATTTSTTTASTTMSTTTTPKPFEITTTEEQQLLGSVNNNQGDELLGARTTIKINWYQTTPSKRYFIDQDRKNKAGNLVAQVPY